MGYAKIQGKLTSRIGCLVKFGAPRDVQEKGGNGAAGKIVAEVWAESLDTVNDVPVHAHEKTRDCWGDYVFCSQRIEWKDGQSSIRLAYYRRRCGENHWEYASQMTVNADPVTIKVLLKQTLAQTAWFEIQPSADLVLGDL